MPADWGSACVGHSSHAPGVIACVIGNVMISLSFNLQRLAHTNNTEGVPYTRLKGWWLGIICMLVGEVGNFLAYGMAPASLVSPLGVLHFYTRTDTHALEP